MKWKWFLLSLFKPMKPWWISVVMYFACGILLIDFGATSGEKATTLLAIALGILFIFIGIFGVVMRPLTRK